MDIYMEAYLTTRSDAEAAKLVERSRSAFREWREKRGLPPRGRRVEGSKLSKLLRAELRLSRENLNQLIALTERFLETRNGTDRAALVDFLGRLHEQSGT